MSNANQVSGDSIISREFTQATHETKKPFKQTSFNAKKLWFILPIIIGLGLLFISSMGGVGLLSHSTHGWVAQVVQTLSQSNNPIALHCMLWVAGVSGFVTIVLSIYGILKKDKVIETELKEIEKGLEREPVNKSKEPKSEENRPTEDPLKNERTARIEIAERKAYDPTVKLLPNSRYTLVAGASNEVKTLYAKDDRGEVSMWFNLNEQEQKTQIDALGNDYLHWEPQKLQLDPPPSETLEQIPVEKPKEPEQKLSDVPPGNEQVNNSSENEWVDFNFNNWTEEDDDLFNATQMPLGNPNGSEQKPLGAPGNEAEKPAQEPSKIPPKDSKEPEKSLSAPSGNVQTGEPEKSETKDLNGASTNDKKAEAFNFYKKPTNTKNLANAFAEAFDSLDADQDFKEENYKDLESHSYKFATAKDGRNTYMVWRTPEGILNHSKYLAKQERVDLRTLLKSEGYTLTQKL